MPRAALTTGCKQIVGRVGRHGRDRRQAIASWAGQLAWRRGKLLLELFDLEIDVLHAGVSGRHFVEHHVAAILQHSNSVIELGPARVVERW